jgi:hypothetical protein
MIAPSRLDDAKKQLPIAPSPIAPPLKSPLTRNQVTLRAFAIGLLLSSGIAAANNWLTTVFVDDILGGIQMPFGAVFVLLLLLLINIPLRRISRRLALSSVELLTVYSMLLFGAMISTPGCDNQFLTIGPGLFYFSTPENGWANLFYKFVPSWFAPGWNGATFQKDVIEKLYLGGLSWGEIPWHAWTAMFIAWGIFLLLIYATLFFLSLALRRQWIEHESLAFPLLELPLQMVKSDEGEAPPSHSFWSNRTLWAGVAFACFAHFFKGMNAIFPDWPIFPVNYYGSVSLSFTEQPWNAIGNVNAKIFLGGIGIAYLLTREVSFSFWFFFLFALFEQVFSALIGFPPGGLPKSGIVNQPTFLIYQSIGGWVMMGVLLLWTARRHLMKLGREAIHGRAKNVHHAQDDEPFSARVILGGLLLSIILLLAWCAFARINLLIALIFFGIFLLTSIVLARLVVEGGLIFPQATYYPLEWMSTGIVGAGAMGAANITKLTFLQGTILLDTRTNALPGFLHIMKAAHELGMNRRERRRLLLSVVVAIVVALAVTFVTSLYSLYSNGGLAGYTWFGKGAPQTMFKTAARMINDKPGVQSINLFWMVVGAVFIWLIVMMRARYLWFPLHPLGFILASSGPIQDLWFSFFIGWLVKTLVMKYGGSSGYTTLRPFMLGLILGNLLAMIFWVLVSLKTGHTISYWPA